MPDAGPWRMPMTASSRQRRGSQCFAGQEFGPKTDLWPWHSTVLPERMKRAPSSEIVARARVLVSAKWLPRCSGCHGANISDKAKLASTSSVSRHASLHQAHLDDALLGGGKILVFQS
jgi:hypothetical protein